MLKNKLSLRSLYTEGLCLGAWFFTTCLVDFIIMPAVFGELKGIENGVMIGGAVGAKLFPRYNVLEILLALGLCFSLWRYPLRRKVETGLAILLVIIPLVYAFYFTPQIRQAFVLMTSPDLSEPLKDAARERHAWFHHTYVMVDGVKLLVLLAYAALRLWWMRPNEEVA